MDKAGYGALASQKARTHPPDILMVQTLMPEIDGGLGIASRIFKESRCAVILVAANVLNEELRFLRKQGCACMALNLPFENSDLRKKLELLRREVAAQKVRDQGN